MQNRIRFKIIVTGLNFMISIMLGILVPRAIGPVFYGDFSYITSTYSFLFQFLMFTSSTAYIYFLSHGKYKIESVNTFYMIFLAIISMFVIVIGLITINSEFGVKYLWNGLEDKKLLLLGLVLTILATFQQRLIEFSDSTSQTIVSEKLKLASKFIMLLVVLAFMFMDSLNIYWYFILSIANFILFFILFFRYITFNFSKVNILELKLIFNDFYIYLKPLIIFTLIAAIYSYLGKYVLQSLSGSLEQGYYNFAFQLALIPVTFISSIMAIYMSEMTKRFKANDLVGVKEIFVNNIFKIYAIHAFVSFFMMINAKEIILLTVGESYLGAVGALQALSIFSLLHTFGMLSGNLFFSSGRNNEYSIINSFTMILGIIYLSYILQYGRLDAMHLAIIMLGFYMLRVIIQLYVNLNFLGINKFIFISKLSLITCVIFISIKIIYIFDINILLNLFLSIILLMMSNFIFKSYIKIKKFKVMKK